MSTTLRVGILNDLSAGPDNPGDIDHWLRLGVEELASTAVLHDPVEFVTAHGHGLPDGRPENVERAFSELAAQGVLLVVGPAIGDNALIATPLADRYRLPVINWAGSEYARSEYMFQLQVGSHQDEPRVMAAWLAARGLSRLGVIHDDSPIGSGYLEALEHTARLHGLQVVAGAAIGPTAQAADRQAEQVFARAPDAFAYLGLGHCLPAVNAAVDSAGWGGVRLMSSAGIRGYHPRFARCVEGWVYIDLWSEGNTVLADLKARRHIAERDSFAAAKGYDLGRLVAHGLANAPEASREGVRLGLERTKWLDAAEGEDGTLLGFGRWDRGALHGRYLVPRRWVNGQSLPA